MFGCRDITSNVQLIFVHKFGMESSKIEQKCRACLCTGCSMHNLYEKYNFGAENAVDLLQLLQTCASIQASFDDAFPQYICKLCLEKLVDSYRFRLQCEKADMQLRAEQEVKDITYDEPEEPVPKIQQRTTCNQCGKEFKHRASMIKHARKHGITTRSCPYCDESVSSAVLLARHMEQTHAHLKTIKCPQCDKSFFKQANLRLHMNVHSGIKRHMCEVCGVSFALAGNLAAHRRLHTGMRPYTCSHCGRGFAQQAALRSHEASHSDRKDHVCSECGAAFSRAGALRNHCKRHLPVRPFACTLCSKSFTFSSERKRHMTIHTGEKNHECDVCGSRFNRSTNLAVHRRIHTGETPHVCGACGKRFSQAHCLRTHMTATH